MTLRIGSLFSGYGGLDLAVERVFGGEVVWHVENDPAPSTILARHWPGVPNFGDVKSIDWAQVPSVDILTGGYPCQPFSAAGRRKGEDDDRHLWPYVREAIRVLRPRYTLLENVAGHRSLGFGRVLGDLAEDGMHVRWVSVRASEVGAPHHRERLFILVTPADSDCSGQQSEQQPFPVPEEVAAFVGGEFPLPELMFPTPVAQPPGGTPANHLRKKPGRARVTDLAMIVEHGLLETGGELPDEFGVLPTPRAAASRTSRSTMLASGSSPSLEQAVEIAAGEMPRELRSWEEAPASWQPSSAPALRWGRYEDCVRRWERVFGMLAPEPTEPCRSERPRLSARFVEWLMGLPSGWVSDVPGVSYSAQIRALGNGVCPPQALVALMHLLGWIAPAAGIENPSWKEIA